MTPDYEAILADIYRETLPLLGRGRVATYIPALAEVDPNQVGMAIQMLDGRTFQIGSATTPFSIQSISKVLTFSMIFRVLGDQVWSRMGREPSGTPFNSLILLETENGIPRNPFINAGALVTADCLLDISADPLTEVLSFVREVTNNPDIEYDAQIAASEKATGFRNAALVNLMKSFGNIRHDVQAVLHLYFHQCSLMLTCADLARAFLFLANRGVNPWNGSVLLTLSQAKRLNALMQTCGLYDESGEFAFTVGLPGKSGVSGGIVAVIPNLLAICVWSPALNGRGNSVVGMKALELFTTKTGISIF